MTSFDIRGWFASCDRKDSYSLYFVVPSGFLQWKLFHKCCYLTNHMVLIIQILGTQKWRKYTLCWQLYIHLCTSVRVNYCRCVRSLCHVYRLVMMTIYANVYMSKATSPSTSCWGGISKFSPKFYASVSIKNLAYWNSLNSNVYSF